MFLDESWRVDFCQIYCTHLQAGFRETLLPCWVFLGMHFDVNTKSVNFSKSLALLSLKQSHPTVPELAGWILTLVEIDTLVCTMSSTLTLVATEELTRTSILEPEPP